MGNFWCQLDATSPLCTPPDVPELELLNIQILYLEEQIHNPATPKNLIQFYKETVKQLVEAIALLNNCNLPKVNKPCPCLQPGFVYDKNGSLELQTLNYILNTQYNITQGIFIKPCLLYFYTPVIVYQVTFGVNGAKFQIKRLYRIDGDWVLLCLSGYMSQVTQTLLMLSPFISADQVPTYWSGIRLPQG